MVEYVHYTKSKGPRLFKIGRYSFSSKEILHLAFALFMLTLTFMALDFNRVKTIGILNFILIYTLSVGLGFILHELGHKLVAQHYGYISEFRADFFMLIIAFGFAISAGFVFFAPGAVMIFGRLSKRENGIVSMAGPLVNLVLAIIFLLIAVIVNPSSSLVLTILYVGVLLNSWLGIFNMIPFWIFDGKKILAWNKGVYILLLGSLIVIKVLSALFFF